MTTAQAPAQVRPDPIKAVAVRHPGRWAAVLVIAVLGLMFVHLLTTNKAFGWRFMVDNMFRDPVLVV